MSGELLRVLWDKSWFEPMDTENEMSIDNARGDAAGNLNSEKCRLSFFRVPEGVEVASIAIAVASLRSSLDDVDYCVVDKREIEEIGCTFDEEVRGETHISAINSLHLDVCGLNLPKLSKLTYLMVANGRVGRIRGREVRKLLKQAVSDGRLDVEKLRPGLRKVLE